MSRPTALQVVRTALQQYHVTEYPAGSNNVKYNTAYYGHSVSGKDYAWCATFVWWVGWIAAGKDQKLNPFVKNANAADIQTLTVKQKWGKYILVHTSDNKKKKAAIPKVQMGDEISFNFSGGTSRAHTGIVVGKWGNYYWCIEGNTSFDDKGSQSNGGAVAYRERFYTTGVCIVRPDYADGDFYKPNTMYLGQLPTLPVNRGWFIYGDKGENVKKLQAALSWANGHQLAIDGDFGSYTFAEVVIFQVANGLEPDGEFGEKCLSMLTMLVLKQQTPPTSAENGDLSEENNEANTNTNTQGTAVKSKATRLYERAKEDAYAYGTKKSRYKYPGGKPKKQYETDLEDVYPTHKKWSDKPEHGVSCDVFVGVVARASGVDPKFPRGLDEVKPYVEKHPKKWEILKITDRDKMRKGDIIYQIYKSGNGHECIYMGGNRVANAHYYKSTYPVIEAYTSIIHKKENCKEFFVIRAKE